MPSPILRPTQTEPESNILDVERDDAPFDAPWTTYEQALRVRPPFRSAKTLDPKSGKIVMQLGAGKTAWGPSASLEEGFKLPFNNELRGLNNFTVDALVGPVSVRASVASVELEALILGADGKTVLAKRYLPLAASRNVIPVRLAVGHANLPSGDFFFVIAGRILLSSEPTREAYAEIISTIRTVTHTFPEPRPDHDQAARVQGMPQDLNAVIAAHGPSQAARFAHEAASAAEPS